jgi:hypothetical protein
MREAAILSNDNYLDLLAMTQIKAYLYRNKLIKSLRRASLSSIQRYSGTNYNYTTYYIRVNAKRIDPNFKDSYIHTENKRLLMKIWIREPEKLKYLHANGVVTHEAYYIITIFDNYVLNENFLIEYNAFNELMKKSLTENEKNILKIKEAAEKALAEARKNPPKSPDLRKVEVVNIPELTGNLSDLQKKYLEKWSKMKEGRG